MVNLKFVEGDPVSKFEQAVQFGMQSHIDYFVNEIKKIRTGRAHTSLVEDLPVECYGNTMKLRDVATITAPDAQLIVIQPWDKGNLAHIEKAIAQSDLGITPQNDGSVLRIKIAPMSAEQRDRLIKNLGKKLEECKVAVRNVRKEFNNFVRDLQKNRDISEDTEKRLQASLQKVTDQFVEQADKQSAKKEAEIKSV